MTGPPPASEERSRRPVFGVNLSPRGRERFGELLAKQLWLTAGGLAVLIIVPAFLGAVKVSGLAFGLIAAGALALVASGTLVHYFSVERVTDPRPTSEATDA